MKVIPDVLPDLHPSIDLHVTARTSPEEFRKTKKVQVAIEPGAYLSPEQVGGTQVVT
jgi:large subunit ribosomal protein L35